MKEIPLSKRGKKYGHMGLVALVDDEDFDYLMRWNWSVKKSEKDHTFYAHRRVSNKEVGVGTAMLSMHRAVLRISDAEILIDHENRNGLHNYKSNLRICTSSENQRNKKSTIGSTSVYLGVDRTKRKRGECWRTRITVNKKERLIGVFDDEITAAFAYNIAAKEHFGEFANLNVIEA